MNAIPSTRSAGLLVDDPVTTLSEDLYDRSGLVGQISRAVVSLGTEGGRGVVALVGARGSGKTSLLRMATSGPEVEACFKVVHFNPWRISSGEQLAGELFAEISAALPRGRARRRARRAIARYLERAAPLATLLVRNAAAGDALSRLSPLVAPNASLEAARRRAASAVAACRSSLLVVIDDIDRLGVAEAGEVFRLARLVADLPGVVYLMAFDLATVAAVAARSGRGATDDRCPGFLDKLVDVSISVPMLHPSQRRAAVESMRDDVISRLELREAGEPTTGSRAMSRNYRWEGAVCDASGHPRELKKLFVQVLVEFPPLRGEVDFGDYVLATLLRSRYPAVWAALEGWRAELLNARDYDKTPTRASLVALWDGRLHECGVPPQSREGVLGVLHALFPSAELRHDPYPVSGFQGEPLRFANDLYFNRFIFGVVGPSDVSDVLVEAAVSAAAEGRVADALESIEALPSRWLLYRKLSASPSSTPERIGAAALLAALCPLEDRWEAGEALAGGARLFASIPPHASDALMKAISKVGGLPFAGEILLRLAAKDGGEAPVDLAQAWLHEAGLLIDGDQAAVTPRLVAQLAVLDGPSRARTWLYRNCTTLVDMWGFLGAVGIRPHTVSTRPSHTVAEEDPRIGAIEELLGPGLVALLPSNVLDERAEYLELGEELADRLERGRRVVGLLHQRACGSAVDRQVAWPRVSVG